MCGCGVILLASPEILVSGFKWTEKQDLMVGRRVSMSCLFGQLGVALELAAGRRRSRIS